MVQASCNYHRQLYLVQIVRETTQMDCLRDINAASAQQNRDEYIESLSLTFDHELVTPLNNCLQVLEKVFEKVAKNRGLKQRLGLVYYQAFQTKNYLDNLRVLSESHQQRAIDHEAQNKSVFSPQSVIGTVSRVLSTQAEIQKSKITVKCVA